MGASCEDLQVAAERKPEDARLVPKVYKNRAQFDTYISYSNRYK